MGTRNLTVVVADGENKIAQYCQWDGYPSGQGANILKFLQGIKKKKAGVEYFKKAVRECSFVNDKEYVKIIKRQTGVDVSGDYITYEQSVKIEEKCPELHRDTGAEILNLVYTGRARKLRDSGDFINDKVFCEWAYEVNLDKKTLTVFSGEKKKSYPFSKLPSVKSIEKYFKVE